MRPGQTRGDAFKAALLAIAKICPKPPPQPGGFLLVGADPIDQPILPREPLLVPREVRRIVRAALEAETLWLIQSGELERAYRQNPDFNNRSAVIGALLEKRIARNNPKEWVTVVAHAHNEALSLALHMDRRRDNPEPPADRFIPLRLIVEREDPTGRRQDAK